MDEGMAAVAAIADRQYGVFSRRQAIACGLSEAAIAWRLRNGDLVMVFRNAYRFARAPETHEMRLKAALLSAPKSVLSHLTAAKLYGLSVPDPPAIDLLQPYPKRTELDGVEARRSRHRIRSVEWDGLARTILVDTLVDLAVELDEEALEIALDSALRKYKQARAWLAELFRTAPQRRRGIGVLKHLMASRWESSPESPLESKVFRRLRLRGLPMPTCQHDVFDAQGHVMRIDLAWLRHRVAAHTDGWQFHDGRQQFDHDADQRSRLSVLGWTQLFITHTMLEDQAWLDRLAVVLSGRDPQLKLFK